jgi:hypothetical protein
MDDFDAQGNRFGRRNAAASQCTRRLTHKLQYSDQSRGSRRRIDARGEEAEFRAVPINDAKTVKSVIEKFREKYGASDVKNYYSKLWRSWQRWANNRGFHLVDLSIAEAKLTLHVRGADKLWAFKSSLEIPLVHIAGVRADPGAARGWYHGIRMPGTNVPGVITAGTFYQDGKRVFWDVHNPEKTIVIDLHDERYNELVLEVDDPDAAVNLIQNAL